MNIRPRFFDDRYFDIGADAAAGPASVAEGDRVAKVIPIGARRDETLIYGYGALTVDITAHVACLDGALLSLTRREFALLAFFVRNPHRVFTRDELLAAVWGDGWERGTALGRGRGRTVDVHVTRLRTKMKAIDFPLETVRGIGYRFRPSASAGTGVASRGGITEGDATHAD